MDTSEHCKLCDHQINDFKSGIACGLTQKKADFSQKCNVIKLENTFKAKIKDINIEYESILKTKVDVLGHFVLYLLAALFFFIGGFLVGKYIFEVGFISTVPLIIMAIGLGPLGLAFGPLNNYNQSRKIAHLKKKRLDYISKLYGYNYNIDIEHFKDSLGNLSYKSDLKIRRINNTIIK